uniref:Uncharacterized protein n=1 Tax=Cacopsylla melanoneura TaxID=428564 RepID=A0A8D9F4Q8_9HEMI
MLRKSGMKTRWKENKTLKISFQKCKHKEREENNLSRANLLYLLLCLIVILDPIHHFWKHRTGNSRYSNSQLTGIQRDLRNMFLSYYYSNSNFICTWRYWRYHFVLTYYW